MGIPVDNNLSLELSNSILHIRTKYFYIILIFSDSFRNAIYHVKQIEGSLHLIPVQHLPRIIHYVGKSFHQWKPSLKLRFANTRTGSISVHSVTCK